MIPCEGLAAQCAIGREPEFAETSVNFDFDEPLERAVVHVGLAGVEAARSF